MTRIGLQYPPNIEPPSLILPLIYDVTTNHTQLAEKRETPPALGVAQASTLLKHFAQYQTNNDCSIFPALREVLVNLVLPTEPQQPSPVQSGAIQSPAMQMVPGGQPGGYPVNMPMGMMGPQ